ncbi:hypothetical protein [Sulfurospirillum cavolei]|uniref:hypothetical protein n=1 Tax=Sulfurospirillum cavolei TaxID=366522 RepID=UPI0005AAD3B4|nr:hypothetical protein [Sulfurospirillum cavolei]
MHTYLIGQLEEVRPVERKNKNGELISMIDVMVTFTSRDLQGYLVKSTDTLSYPADLLSKFSPFKGKFIAIPHVFLTTKTGNYLFPDQNMSFLTFDRDPLLTVEVKKVS